MTNSKAYPVDCFARKEGKRGAECTALSEMMCKAGGGRCPFYQTVAERSRRDGIYGSAAEAEKKMQSRYWRAAKRERALRTREGTRSASL